ncbi:hypothetical protein NQ318_022028 [Aromia moschata]|uniref:Uncharacterized protein n=1 Tax=Aromia moschata TaxID=1265417 RepID=A0AAV8Z7W4_9CUCU|nr:hypothetical protein NQ318_022028 [Aromia moschata]
MLKSQDQLCVLFNELYPNISPINKSIICCLVNKFQVTSSIKDSAKSGRPKTATGGDKALDILLSVRENPIQSSRILCASSFRETGCAICHLVHVRTGQTDDLSDKLPEASASSAVRAHFRKLPWQSWQAVIVSINILLKSETNCQDDVYRLSSVQEFYKSSVQNTSELDSSKRTFVNDTWMTSVIYITEVIHVLVQCSQLKELLLLPKVCVKTQKPQLFTEHNNLMSVALL